MFSSNFTGNSKRVRNVNLSGQRNTNPWASSGWGASVSGTGASHSIAQAQAEREKRKRTRDELLAAQRIQRLWRGYRDRRNTKVRHRQEWDEIYGAATTSIRSTYSDASKASRALPLLLYFFDPALPEDQHRLDIMIGDWGKGQPWNFEAHQRNKFAILLVSALERRPENTSEHVLLLTLAIFRNHPSSARGISDRYYKLLATYCSGIDENGNFTLSSADQEHLVEALAILLTKQGDQEYILESYEAFALFFLTSANDVFWAHNTKHIAECLDLPTLSRVIVHAFTKPSIYRKRRDDLMWLLAHFIALNRTRPSSQGTLYLHALYQQLSILAADIRSRSTPQDQVADSNDDEEEETESPNPLPPYVKSQLDFLVHADGINELLTRFTSTAASSRTSEDANLLAGYTLLLLRCFPTHSDDIKMRLFGGDVTTKDSNTTTTLPSVKFLWKGASATSIFPTIADANERHKSGSIVALLEADTLQDQEWRTILLFLELYSFLLRVTDDEDFLPAENEVQSEQSPAVTRIRSSGLNLTELTALISFLKNLSFTLYYNLPDVMKSMAQSTLQESYGFATSAWASSSARPTGVSTTSFAGIVGTDVLTLRSLATQTLRSLYERDSRRPFLPKGFWLMTSKFEMDGFLSAVVLEHSKNESTDDEDEDEEMAGSDIGRADGFRTVSGQRISQAAQIERQRQFKRVNKEKLLAQARPRLEILRNMPFVIPFDVRVQIFRQFVYLDKLKRRGGHVDPELWRLAILNDSSGFDQTRNREILGRHSATIRRGSIFVDAWKSFAPLHDGLKEPIQITFVDQFGQPEAGIDGGGVTKEFLTSVVDEALISEAHSLFITNQQNLLYPNPAAFDDKREELLFSYDVNNKDDAEAFDHALRELEDQYDFLGRITGKCMYEGILIDVSFAGFFLNKWASSTLRSSTDFRANLNDLRDMDPAFYNGLIKLKNYPGDVTDLAIDFTITDTITNPITKTTRTVTRPLRKDGENILVSNADRPLYISYVANYLLTTRPGRQTKAFLRGLGSIIEPSWLSMFNQSELQRLVGGDSSEIDVEDLRRNTSYSGVYVIGDDGQEHPVVQRFWEVMHSFEDSARRQVLKYVTSTPRAPLLGFSQLKPSFAIRDSGRDEERLPSASTCMNLLKLPQYSTVKTMRDKLLYAIQAGAGFDLSWELATIRVEGF